MTSYNDTIRQRRRLGYLILGLVVFGALMIGRLAYLQTVRHSYYKSKAQLEHTRKDELPARRGELYVHDGETERSPLALNQMLNVLEADPSEMTDKPAAATKIAGVLGGSSESYVTKLNAGKRYAKLAERLSNADADRIKALKLKGVWTKRQPYRTYPEGSLAAQVIGFVNNSGAGQYGIEQYLNDQLAGVPGQLSGKTDINGVPIATADNILKPPVDGTSYLLTIDRNIQAMAETALAKRVDEARAKSGSVVILDPATGAVKAMATYPSYDPNNYTQVKDYSVFLNQAVDSQFEPGSGIKAFTIAAGLDRGKITPDSTYDDPGCYKIDQYNVCNAHGDKSGRGKTMTVVLRDSLNTGVMHMLRLLGGNPDKITLAGKKILYDYFTKHFGFGQRTGIEQANEAAGALNAPSNAAGSDVNYANMSFGQGMSVTMVQMTAAMAAIANGGTLYQPHLVGAELLPDGTAKPIRPKVVRDHVISPTTSRQLSAMLQTVVQRGSGYRTNEYGNNRNYKIAGKTGTAQIPKPDGKGYIEGKNIGTFTGFAPVDNPKFVIMVQINQPGVAGYAESTTVPVFGEICDWLFKYYGIPPTS